MAISCSGKKSDYRFTDYRVIETKRHMPVRQIVLNYQTKFERLELKYLVNEQEASCIRRDIQNYCKPDRYNAQGRSNSNADYGYPILSCYLDSPGLAFHKAKERGDPNRIKLRIRTYSPTSLASLEIKRRVSSIISKTRVAIDRRQAENAARGLPVIDGPGDANALSVLSDFALVAGKSGAEPTLTIQYDREAFESTVDHYARVTFDRKIRVQAARDWMLTPKKDAWNNFDDYWATQRSDTPVVLELKCETSPPVWMVDLIQRHQLALSSFSKYSIGVALCQQSYGLGRRLGRRSLKAMEKQ
jgi:hypothetical protein